jgi:cytoskeletal protein CcmA (bactofilin family)
VSSGRIEGVITANKKIQLLKPAVLIGDVHTPTFAMEEGVYFQGECDMGVVPHSESDLDERRMDNGQLNASSTKLETESLSL